MLHSPFSFSSVFFPFSPSHRCQSCVGGVCYVCSCSVLRTAIARFCYCWSDLSATGGPSDFSDDFGKPDAVLNTFLAFRGGRRTVNGFKHTPYAKTFHIFADKKFTAANATRGTPLRFRILIMVSYSSFFCVFILCSALFYVLYRYMCKLGSLMRCFYRISPSRETPPDGVNRW